MKSNAHAARAVGLGLVFAALSATALADEAPPQVVYPLVGTAQVFAPENAVAGLYLGLYGTVTVLADGTVTGGGAIIYDRMEPCAWEPPEPDGTSAPYCNIEGVVDAAFTVTGTVQETVHRHDSDNPFKDGVFTLADAHSGERLDYAPLRLRLTLHFEGRLAERLAFWGFSQSGIEFRDTEAAMLGVLVSGLFEQEFEIVPIGMAPLEDGPGAEAITAARQHFSEGDYGGGTPLSAAGSVGFVDIDPARLPTATNPWVYLQHAVEPAGERPLSEAELAAIADHRAGNGPDAHDFDRDILDGGLQELAEGLADFLDRPDL